MEFEGLNAARVAEGHFALSAQDRRLLRAAAREFVRLGYDAASIDGIARTGGISKETIYRRFASKESLFQATMADIADRYVADARAISELNLAPEEALTRHAIAIAKASADGGFVSGVWLAIVTARDMPEFATRLQASYTRGLAPLCHTIRSALGVQADRYPLLEWAEDFGSLSVCGARHVMGYPEKSRSGLASHARRSARLFLQGSGSKRASFSSALPAFPHDLGEVPAQQAARPNLARLLDVASDHFIARGYHGTNLDEVGDQARVGRGTLYRHFDSKAGLFEAAMINRSAELAASAHWAAALSARPIDALRSFLAAAGQALTTHDSIALHRAVIGEVRRTPALARKVHDIVRSPWIGPLSSWLGEAARAGCLILEDPDWYATQLLVLASRGNRRTISGKSLTPADSLAAADRAVDMLLHGLGDCGG